MIGSGEQVLDFQYLADILKELEDRLCYFVGEKEYWRFVYEKNGSKKL